MHDALGRTPFGQHHFQFARTDGRRADELRQQRHPQPAPGRFEQHGEITGDQARLHLDVYLHSLGVDQFPHLRPFMLAHGERGQPGQFVRRGRAAVGLEQGRAGNQRRGGVPKTAHHQVGIGIQLVAHANGQVIAFADHIDAAVVGQYPDLHLGELGQEIRQQVGKHRLRQRDRTAQPHHAARLGAQFVHRVLGRLRFLQHGTAMRIEALAYLGYHEAARGPLQQAHAEALFQLGYALAQAGLGYSQRAARRRKAAMLDHGRKEVQVVQILQGAAQCRHRRFLYGAIDRKARIHRQIVLNICDSPPIGRGGKNPPGKTHCSFVRRPGIRA